MRAFRILFALLLVLCTAGTLHAQAGKPARNVEFISASGAGSASDGVIRTVETAGR